jgi:hypothetical protein
MEELRFYSFTDWMFRPIQQGIQPGHAAVELFTKYHPHYCKDEDGEAMDVLYDWATNWKTFICLNGGNYESVVGVHEFLNSPHNPYPFAPFHEDEASAAGRMTTVGIVLPARIFETASLLRMRELPPGICYTFDRLLDVHRFTFDDDDGIRADEFSAWEFELMQLLNKFSLAT